VSEAGNAHFGARIFQAPSVSIWHG